MLNQDPRTQNIPFLFLSAKAEKEDFRQGMNLGADDYLTKPFTEMDLLNTVEKRLQKNVVSNSAGVDSFYENQGINVFLTSLLNNNNEVKTKSIGKKTNVYFEGDSANDIYFIKSGLLRLYFENQDSKEFSIDVLTENDFFGTSGLTSSK